MAKLMEGLQVTAVGVGIVFVGLVILIGLVKLIGVTTGALGKAKEAPKLPQQPETLPAPTVIEEEPAAQDDTALIAVITAAIAAMLDDNSNFVVRKVRRVSNTPAWSKAGREEQIYSRF